MLYYIIIILIIIIFLIVYNNSYENFSNYSEPSRFFDISEYKNKMFNNNDTKNLYKISLADNVKLYEEDCFQKCDRENCIKLSDRINSLEKCLKCNLQKNKCFNKTIINGSCDDCDGVEYNDKVNCLDISNYGCVNPKNINLHHGVKPYYIEVDTNNVESPYNKKCVFCWDLTDNI
jgi:hypothetical protein